MFSKKSGLFIGLLILMVSLAACGGGDSGSSAGRGPTEPEAAAPVSLGDADAGKKQFEMICSACHGVDGEGIEGLGKPFTTSTFLKEKSDEEMVEFIKVGRPSSDPLNTTGVDMPPKGGNPALNEDQILDIIAYVRTLEE